MSKQLSFTSIGDTCVDIYPDHNKVFLGGTAFNVAYHAHRAGARASIISAVGSDGYGELFFKTAKEQGISTDHLVALEGSTSSVMIPLDSEGKPVFSGWELGVLDQFELTQKDEQFLQTQDIARTILLKPLQKVFNQFSRMKLPNTFTVGDFAGGSQYSIPIEEVSANIKSLDMIVRSVDATDKRELSLLKQITQMHSILILASLGGQGSIVFTKEHEYFQAAIPTNVTDTTGAGDAYIAYFLVSYLTTKDVQKSMEAGTKAAAKVITQWGANQE